MTPDGESGSDVPSSGPIPVSVDPDIADLIPGFLDNRRKDVGMIRDAMVRRDFPTVQRLGHSMKGAGGGYGFEVITEIGAALERSAKEQDSGEIERRTLQLEDYLQRVEITYDE